MMKFWLIVLVAVTTEVARSAGRIQQHVGQFIIGGEDARPGEFSYQALVKVLGSAICGGILIDENHVLTAAHCVDSGLKASAYDVVLGEHNLEKDDGTEQEIGVSNIEIHYGWDPENAQDDIALLTLEHCITENEYVKPIEKLASRFDRFTDRDCVVSGWGFTRVVVDEDSNGPPGLTLLVFAVSNNKTWSCFGCFQPFGL